MYNQDYRRTHHDSRENSNDRGYGARWRKYRKIFLSQPENVLCKHCLAEGKDEPSTVVDHIIPAKVAPHLFWESSNHQGLCTRHHNIKTIRESQSQGKMVGRHTQSPIKDGEYWVSD